LIAQNGEDRLTLSAVANEADIAHATIYGYFSSKREMLAALSSEPESAGSEPVEPVLVVAAEEAVSAPAAIPAAYDDPEDTIPWDDDARPGEVAEFHPPAANEQPMGAPAEALQPDDTTLADESATDA